MRKLEDIYSAFLDGDYISDEEAIALRDQFKLASTATLPLGDRFRLAFVEANHNYLRLNDILKERWTDKKSLDTTKKCPQCGNEKLILIRTQNHKFCSDCDTKIDWNLEKDQKPLL